MDDLKIGAEKSHSQPFELVLVTRDSDGNPTGTKQCIADNGYKISQFFLRHVGKPKPKGADAKKEDLKIIRSHKSMQSYVDTSERVVAEDNTESK